VSVLSEDGILLAKAAAPSYTFSSRRVSRVESGLSPGSPKHGDSRPLCGENFARLPSVGRGIRRHRFFTLRTFLGAFFVVCAMLKCSSFLPALIAAASQSGFSPRPAQVSLGFSGLRYFGATGPRAPSLSPLERNEEVVRDFGVQNRIDFIFEFQQLVDRH
jgi:hypothetical protein